MKRAMKVMKNEIDSPEINKNQQTENRE